MNLFILHTDPVEAAKAHCDKHVVKMCLETAQLLSSVVRKINTHMAEEAGLYKITHQNHPCTVWVGASRENYEWTLALQLALFHEYAYRYGRRHASERLYPALRGCRTLFGYSGRTPWAQAMPEELRGDCAVSAYRRYYVTEKARMLQYTRREPPGWLRHGELLTK